MFSAHPSQAFAAATAPLLSNFGDGLTLWRDGNVVHWSYDDQTIVVEMEPDGSLGATFVDRPMTDEVSHGPAAAVYRRRGDWRYRLTPDGCGTIVADMMDFFSGIREPRFTFVATTSAGD